MPTLSEAITSLSPTLYWKFNDAAVAAPANFLNDTFTDVDNTALASHVGETGATWTSHVSFTAGAEVNNNRANGNAAANRVYYASGTPPSADYKVTATVYCVSATGRVNIVLRQDAAADTHYHYRIDSAGTTSIRKRVAGVETNLVSGTNIGAWSGGQSKTVTFQAIGHSLVATVDGTVTAVAMDTAVTDAGKAGLMFNGGDATGSTAMGVADMSARGVRSQTIQDATANNNDGAALGDNVTLEQAAIITGEGNLASFGNDPHGHVVADAYSPFVQGSSRTFLVVAKRNTDSNFDVLFGGHGAGTAGDHPVLEAIDEGNGNVLKWYGNILGTFPFGGDWSVDWDNDETHIAGLNVIDAATQSAILYFDGTNFGAPSVAQTQYHASSGRFLVGAHGNYTAGEGFNGPIQAVAVWERILTGAEHRFLAQAAGLRSGGISGMAPGKPYRLPALGGPMRMIGT